LCKKYMKDRKVYKIEMIRAKQQKEKHKAEGTLTPELAKELDVQIARCNNMQMARKIQINSLYGAIGNAFFRYFSLDFAEAITLSGQLAAMWTETRLNEYMNKLFETTNYEYVIYADTDSNYLTFEPIIEKVFGNKDVPIEKKIDFMDKVEKQKIEPFITSTLAELGEMMNSFEPDALSMKREALADAGIWTGKKYYVLSVYDNEGVRFAEPEIKATGIAMTRSNYPKFCREKIKEAVKIMLQKENSDLINHVSQTRDEFMKLDFEQMGSPTGVKGLEKYSDSKTIYGKGAGAHIKGSLIYNHMIKKLGLEKTMHPIKDGENIKFVYLKKPNPTYEDVISCPGKLPEEFGLEKYIDYDAAFEKSFISPVNQLAKAIDWSLEERATLEDFFG
jgi:DNA polymerase elongation subunit (family B)